MRSDDKSTDSIGKFPRDPRVVCPPGRRRLPFAGAAVRWPLFSWYATKEEDPYN